MPTSSGLFRLPGELRNQVYKHAFSSSSPLLLVMGNKGVSIISSQDCHEGPREFNKFKYVNKRLYLETSGIEALFNDIKVARMEEAAETPGLFFLSWVGLLTPKQVAWLDGCTIVLSDEYYSQPENQDFGIGYGYMWESAKTIAALARFCKTHPVVKVDYHLPGLDLSQGLLDRETFRDMLVAAYSYIYGLVTDNFDDYEWPFGDIHSLDFWDISFWRSHHLDNRYVGIKELQAPNLRFKPREVEEPKLLEHRLSIIFEEGSNEYATILRWAKHGL